MSSRSGPAMFTGNTIIVNDGTFNQTNAGGRQGFDLLSDKTSPNAFYNAGHDFDPPKCHPNTCVAILDRFKNWLRNAADSQEPNTCILWLNGAAGAGKSTIARSLAEWCDEQKMLLASFFFFRMDSSRNSVKNFIPTLAYNISQTVPDSRQRIEQALHSDPHIFSKTLEVQLIRLVIEPLSSRQSHPVSEASSSQVAQLTPERLLQPGAVTPHVFIIDGLDECMDWKGQRALIRLFSTIPNKNLGWKILIASRPEQTIRSSFDEIYSICPFTPVSLSDEYCSDDDIKLYLEDKFAEIKRTHPRGPFIPTDWPSPDDITKLVAKSSGQFIFAATVIRYVSPDSYSPVFRLRSIFNWQNLINSSDLPFAELDVLYTQILKTASERLQDMNPKAVPITVSLCILLGTYSYFLSTLHKSPVDAFSRMLRIDIEDTSTILGELSSIISVKDDEIVVYHASLYDFLFDRARSGSLWVDQTAMWYEIVYYCLSTPLEVYKTPRAIWHVLCNVLKGAYTQQVARHLVSFDFVAAIEMTVCSGDVNDLAFMDVAFFLGQVRDNAMNWLDWMAIYHYFASTFDHWVAGRLQRLCQKTLTHRAYVAFLCSRFSLRLCIEGLHLRRDSAHLPEDIICDAEHEDWFKIFCEDQLLHRARDCVFEDKTRLAGIWFCINFLVQIAITGGAVRFSAEGDRRKLRPWLSRRRLYSRHFRGKGYPQHLPFNEKVDIRGYKRERKVTVDDMLANVFPTVEELLSEAPHSSSIVFALRMADSLIFMQHKFRKTIRRYLADSDVAGVQLRGGFGFFGVSNLYRFQRWNQFQNNEAKLPPHI